MKCKTDFGTYNVVCEVARYGMFDNLCINLADSTDFSPFARLTVNLAGYNLETDEAFVDTNNCPWAEKFIKDNKLGNFTGFHGRSGFCEYPLYKFNMERIS